MSHPSIDLHGKIKTVTTDEHYRCTIKNGKDSVDQIIYIKSIDHTIQKTAPIVIKVPSNISYDIVLDDCFMHQYELISVRYQYGMRRV